MKISIDKKSLVEALLIVQKGLPIKTNAPILNNIKFEMFETSIKLTSSGNNIAIEYLLTSKDLKIIEPGNFVVSSKIIDILRELDCKIIELSIVEDNRVVINSSYSEFSLNMSSILDYPNVEFIERDKPNVISINLLKQIIKETSFSVATNDKRPSITGVNFVSSDNKLICTSTDSIRLSRKTVTLKQKLSEFNIIIPGKILDELLKILEMKSDDFKNNKISDVQFFISSNRILFVIDNINFQSRLLEGSFPDLERTLSYTDFSLVLTLNRFDLLNAIRLASMVASKDDKSGTNLIQINYLENQIVTISSNNNEIGASDTSITPVSDPVGQRLSIYVPSKNVSDVLKILEKSEVTLYFRGEQSAFIIKEVDNDTLIFLLLPTRFSY
ncbi:MAG: DNA polymerase III subunit beta [Acholeplasmatales bacterium]|jgi:DNA polymerase-3 subunit beta|nr:DNA polymerase III subunit beta [Acholeplasmatales bacterium]